MFQSRLNNFLELLCQLFLSDNGSDNGYHISGQYLMCSSPNIFWYNFSISKVFTFHIFYYLVGLLIYELYQKGDIQRYLKIPIINLSYVRDHVELPVRISAQAHYLPGHVCPPCLMCSSSSSPNIFWYNFSVSKVFTFEIFYHLIGL